MFSRLFRCFAPFLLCVAASAQTAAHPRDHEIPDLDTKAWWHTTEALSGDAMEGRDTGTAAYARAADYVAKRFAAAGLQPMGGNGSYLQQVPMVETDVLPQGTRFVVRRERGAELPLEFLQEITISGGFLPSWEGSLVFRGYCGRDAVGDVKGKVVLCFGTQRPGLPAAGERLLNVQKGGAVALITVDDPYFSLEPPRWPFAYARSVQLAGAKPGGGGTFPALRLSATAFAKVLAGSGQDAAAVLKMGGAQEPLANFDLPATLTAKVQTATRDIESPNVLGLLPGTDPVLKDQVLVVSAHLDGYGFGTPVNGDGLYNGTLDDAAYVALLIQMADDLRDGRQRAAIEKMGVGTGQYGGTTLQPVKRSILFCAFTGEEKGLLGSRWFVQHPTVPLAQMVADINLDQLRPLFPLTILTALAINDTTLGATATAVGARDGITVRADREPERGLLRRADHYPFLQAGVPAIGFIFGFEPGTDEERRYRHWYEVQYHRPQDDLTQPVDFQAALHFNVFFYQLVETLGDDAARPKILPGHAF